MTERTQIDSLLSRIIVHFHEALLVEDEHRKVLLANQKFCDFFGYDASPDDLIGMDCSNAAEESKVYFKDPEGFVGRIEEILEKQETVIGDELNLVDGRFLLRDYIPITIEGTYRGHAWKYRDMTEHKRITDELQHLNNLNQKLFSIIAHDLRSPLSSLSTILDFVQEDEFTVEELKELLPKLSKDVGYTSRLVDNLLTWSASRVRGNKINPSTFNLHDTIENVFGLFDSNALEKKVHLFNKVPADFEVKADPDMIETVIRNLTVNALKFTTDGSITISASKKGEETKIKVLDTGIGLDPERIPNLFKEAIAPHWGTHNEKGFGLGLQICKEFVESHGGEIIADNHQAGAVFKFTLPDQQ